MKTSPKLSRISFVCAGDGSIPTVLPSMNLPSRRFSAVLAVLSRIVAPLWHDFLCARLGRSAGFRPAVSQGFQPAGLQHFHTRLGFRESADWKSAIQQVGNLRYFGCGAAGLERPQVGANRKKPPTSLSAGLGAWDRSFPPAFLPPAQKQAGPGRYKNPSAERCFWHKPPSAREPPLAGRPRAARAGRRNGRKRRASSTAARLRETLS